MGPAIASEASKPPRPYYSSNNTYYIHETEGPGRPYKGKCEEEAEVII